MLGSKLEKGQEVSAEATIDHLIEDQAEVDREGKEVIVEVLGEVSTKKEVLAEVLGEDFIVEEVTAAVEVLVEDFIVEAGLKEEKIIVTEMVIQEEIVSKEEDRVVEGLEET